VNLSFLLASANHYSKDIENNDSNNNCNDCSDRDTIPGISYDLNLFKLSSTVKGRQANIRGIFKTSADSIEDTLWLKLATISLFIDDNRRESTCSVLLPVFNFFINNVVRDFN